jgi:hypothetical protein
VRVDRLAAAAVVATIAFAVYTRTLLPGVDVGDTGGFQAAVLWPATSARQAYPLYYNLARPFVASISASNPARGLNLFSAVWGGAAVGLLCWVAATITASTAAGVGAALLLAFSYTFWSQAIIAEVYTLHLALVGACLIALVAFARRPTPWRLAAFFAIYALSFGNHLSMILLLVPFGVFLLHVHPTRRALVRIDVIAMALLIAIAGALQYLPNVLSLGDGFTPTPAWSERLADFWFDATKADWRATMVLGVPRSLITDRIAMSAWDARQQFGIIGLALAIVGAVRIWPLSRPWAVLVCTAYAISTAFAFTYNVGDTHVFFLPSHYFTALLAGVAVAPFQGRQAAPTPPPAIVAAPAPSRVRSAFRRTFPLLLIAYAVWRAWDTWPAVDRHADRRAEQLVAGIATGLNDQQSVLVSQMDWQSENALLYASRWQRRDLAWTRLSEVLLHFPFFVADNHAVGRDIVLTADAAATVVSAYGAQFPLVRDESARPTTLTEIVQAVPRGSIYVLCLLTPSHETPFDEEEFGRALGTLAGGHVMSGLGRGPHDRSGPPTYEVWAGIAGDSPGPYRSSRRPFRTTVSVLDQTFTVRMDSWLTMDTFRRAGFGHVLYGRDHALIVERGVSLLWLPAGGAPRTAYAAGLYAPQPRFRIPTAIMSLAASWAESVKIRAGTTSAGGGS